jgi:hypothetical protein
VIFDWPRPSSADRDSPLVMDPGPSWYIGLEMISGEGNIHQILLFPGSEVLSGDPQHSGRFCISESIHVINFELDVLLCLQYQDGVSEVHKVNIR